MNRIIRSLASRVFLIAGFLTCVAPSAVAQGSVRGIVMDSDGDGISGATVDAENLTSTTSLSVTTNAAGRFSYIVTRRGEWRFVIRAEGFEQVVGSARVSGRTSDIQVRFRMERDRFNPPAPATGVLAGLTANEVIESLDVADELFASGEYDAAIDAYRSLLERAPALTSVNLQIGHAFREKQEPDQALAAYRMALDADSSNAEARAAIGAISQPVR